MRISSLWSAWTWDERGCIYIWVFEVAGVRVAFPPVWTWTDPSSWIWIKSVYSISSKSMRSRSRRGWTCCRTSSSTSTHSASKTCVLYTCLNLKSTLFLSIMKLLVSCVHTHFMLTSVAIIQIYRHTLKMQIFFCGSSVTPMPRCCVQGINLCASPFSFFQDGLKAVDNLKPSIEKLATDLHTVRTTTTSFFFLFSLSDFPLWPTHVFAQIKQVQDEERKQLAQLRDVLKSALQVEQKEVTPTQKQTSVHKVKHDD